MARELLLVSATGRRLLLAVVAAALGALRGADTVVASLVLPTSSSPAWGSMGGFVSDLYWPVGALLAWQQPSPCIPPPRQPMPRFT